MAAITLKQSIARIPHKPGVYQFKDEHGDILYIGKARDLKKRTTSYLQRHPESPKTDQMMKEARGIEITVTQNEVEALLLEATLIRKHLPPYNIFLKDDKHYAFLRVTVHDRFPIIEKVRRVSRDRSKYFGPYVSGAAVNDLLRVAKTFFPYKSCTVSRDNPCLIVKHGEQVGPLHGTNGDPVLYGRAIHELVQFLSGKSMHILERLRVQMMRAATARNFERAALLRDRIHSIERLHQQQDVISATRENFDIANVATLNDQAAGCIMRVRQGRLVHTHRAILAHAENAITRGDLLRVFLEQYYAQTTDFPREVLTSEELSNDTTLRQLLRATIHVPKRGKRRRLLALVRENAEDYLRATSSHLERDIQHGEKLLKNFALALGLPRTPRRIETYDISNIQGRFPVGSMIVFDNGKPAKAEYRKFTIRGQTTPDDFKAMHHMLTRRLQHRPQNRPDAQGLSPWKDPDLIIIDGGKGQLSAAVRALEETRSSDLPIIALAKRLEEVFTPTRDASTLLPPSSDALFLLQRMRDEAHRFAITFYRTRHRKASTRSKLDEIPGVGPKTKSALLHTFGSVAEITRASDAELLRVVRPSILARLRRHL